MIITVHTRKDILEAEKTVYDHAERTVQSIRALTCEPIAVLSGLKFGKSGLHPLEDRPLNFVEQLNQTFTYLVALRAADLLMGWHPDCGGLTLAPGAHAPKGSLDIESLSPNMIVAETFAATSPKSNGKLRKDLDKLVLRSERHRYSFFASPQYPETERQIALERDGIQVWSVKLEGVNF